MKAGSRFSPVFAETSKDPARWWACAKEEDSVADISLAAAKSSLFPRRYTNRLSPPFPLRSESHCPTDSKEAALLMLYTMQAA